MPGDFPRPKTPPPLPDRDQRTRKTPPAGVQAQLAAPESLDVDDLTGQHEVGLITAEQLEEGRAKRPTAEQLRQLRARHDALETTVGETRVIVGKIEGQLSGLPTLTATLASVVGRLDSRDKAENEIDVAEQTAAIKDEQNKRENSRARWTKLITAGIGAVTGLEVIHQLVSWIASKL